MDKLGRIARVQDREGSFEAQRTKSGQSFVISEKEVVSRELGKLLTCLDTRLPSRSKRGERLDGNERRELVRGTQMKSLRSVIRQLPRESCRQ
jgi:hypothetical protein